MTELFAGSILTREDWVQHCQSPAVFSRLIEFIFHKHGLEFGEITLLQRSWHAVFRVGSSVIKIYTPLEDTGEIEDFPTELYCFEHANSLQLTLPKLLASGTISDRYTFNYVVMAFIDGKTFSLAEPLAPDQKVALGRQLRALTDKFNRPCARFNSVNVVETALVNPTWSCFDDNFRAELRTFLQTVQIRDEVFVHGDLYANNVLIDSAGQIVLIDFADARLAPVWYEWVLVAVDLFEFDHDYLAGFFGEYEVEQMTDSIFGALLLHNEAVETICPKLGTAADITSLEILKDIIRDRVRRSKDISDR
jgi:Ser/Thr protein kinase RdoA (MazF antagonist)